MPEQNVIGTFDTAEVLQMVNSEPRPKTFIRTTLFGGRQTTFESTYVIADFRKSKRRMAPFVNRLVGGKLVEREGFDTRRYTPPKVSPRAVFRGDDAFERSAGEVIGGSMSPDERMAKEIARVTNNHDYLITRREEWMCMMMLTTGVIPIVGKGVTDEIDLGFDNTDTLSGTSCWGGADSDILKNVRAWTIECIRRSGISPDTALLGADAADAFLEDANIQKLLDNRNMQVGAVNLRELPNGVKYLGYVDGVDFYQYPEWYIDDTSGEERPMVPDDVAVFFPSSARTSIAEAQMLYGAYYSATKRQTYVGARIPRPWNDEDTDQQFLDLMCFPLPFLADADSWLVATVVE